MKKEIEEIIKSALTNLGLSQDVVFTVEHPEDIKHGDYSSNVALIYSKEVGKNPRDLGQQIKDEIEK